MKREQVCEICANISDMNGEEIGFLLEFALEKGAVDAWALPVLSRGKTPAYRLSVQCMKQDATRMCELLLKHSTATAMTMEMRHRIIMDEEMLYIETSYGMVRVAMAGGRQRILHEDLVRLAQKHNMTLAEINEKLLEEMKA